MPWRLILAFLLLLIAPAANAQVVQREGMFRAQLPPGWVESKATSKKAVAWFVGPFMVNINRVQDSTPPEEYLDRMVRSQMPLALEEDVTLAGLPAKKFTSYLMQRQSTLRMWVYVVLSQGEYWEIVLRGFNKEWDTPREQWDQQQRERWNGAEKFIGSFEFLEPTLSRLKSGVPSQPATAAPRQRSYVLYKNLRVRLAEGWTYDLSGEEGLLSLTGAGKSEALVALRCYQTKDSLEKQRDKIVGRGSKLSEQSLAVDGLPGLKVDVLTQEKPAWRMQWLIIRTAHGNCGVMTTVPSDKFSGYEEAFSKMLASVEVLDKPTAKLP